MVIGIDFPRRRRAWLATIIVVLAAGCNDVPIFGSMPNEPAVYLVMTRDIPLDPFGGTLGDGTIFGLVANLGSARGLQYRPVGQLTVIRRSDGAEYDWSYLPRTGNLENLFTSAVELETEGNLRMPWIGSAGRLGRDSIVGGEVVDLLIETGGHLVTGSTTIPTTPTITVVEAGGITTMHWARSFGAARYWVQAQTDKLAYGGFLTADTSYVITRDPPPFGTPEIPYFTVVALDANLAALKADTTLRRSGIIGAYGYFGAMARDRVVIPPP